jgi:uncharacterized protein YlaN (UPF0358 family)
MPRESETQGAQAADGKTAKPQNLKTAKTETAEIAETANPAALEVQGKSTKTSRCPTMEEVRQQQMWGLREKDNVKWLRGRQRRAVP